LCPFSFGIFYLPHPSAKKRIGIRSDLVVCLVPFVPLFILAFFKGSAQTSFHPIIRETLQKREREKFIEPKLIDMQQFQ
jgi:hypothetical protein